MSQKKSTKANAPGSEYPPVALLTFTPLERKIITRLKTGGRDLSPFFGGMTKLTGWPDLTLVGPILGAPQTAMVLEQMHRKGARSFLSLGWCGALQPGLTWGDIVLPLTALSEEGTSPLYATDQGPAGADPELARRLAEELNRQGVPHTSGRVWTTDAPFRETRTKVRTHAEAGLLAVDMESSALMAVAQFRELAWAGLMVVSDELWGEKWRPGFNSVELKDGLTRAARAVLAVAENLAAESDSPEPTHAGDI